MTGVFEGLRVLDLTSGAAGPMTTMVLADNGAEVWRIEQPGGERRAVSSGEVVWHRGKKRAEFDLDDPEDRQTVARLAASSDIVVESFAPGSLARRQLDHASLAAANPRLITCSITGYGRDNRHSARPGYDALVMARTGLFFDQRGREGTAMTEISGSAVPHPDFGPPEGMRRGTDRPGPVFPRSTWPSLGATYLALLGVTAALRRARAHRPGPVGRDLAPRWCVVRSRPQLAAGREPRCTAVLDVADRQPVDRGSVRVQRRPVGPPLDRPAELGDVGDEW